MNRPSFGRRFGNRERTCWYVHWETQGHLELATGGTTTADILLANKLSRTFTKMPRFAAISPSQWWKSQQEIQVCDFPRNKAWKLPRALPRPSHRTKCLPLFLARIRSGGNRNAAILDRKKIEDLYVRYLGHCDCCCAEMATG